MGILCIMRTTPRNKLSNGGFSLIELLIVIAIIAVMLFFFLMGARLIFTTPARQCARDLKAALEKTRVDTMGRNAAGLKIFKKKDGIYVSELQTVANDRDDSGNYKLPEKEQEKSEKIGTARVHLYMINGTNELKESSSPLILSFRRDTGGFYDSRPDGYPESMNIQFIPYFWVQSGGKVYKLTLDKLTGMIDLKQVDNVGD